MTDADRLAEMGVALSLDALDAEIRRRGWRWDMRSFQHRRRVATILIMDKRFVIRHSASGAGDTALEALTKAFLDAAQWEAVS